MALMAERTRPILHAGDDPALLGGKAAALARLGGLPVPAWFAVSPDAFRARMTEAQRHAFEAGDAAALFSVAAGIHMSEAVRGEIERAVAALSPRGEPLAVRSSAPDEDGRTDSFAGLLESYLFVDPRDVPERVERVWRSGFSPRVAAYRTERGLTGPLRPPAVLVQRMVDAQTSGVAFSVDPVSGNRDVAVVAAVWGLGTGLVSGRCDADTYHVDATGQITARQIGRKVEADRRGTDGTSTTCVPVLPELAERPALDDDAARRVAALARRVADRAGCPQDIEWALEDGHLYLLQARPITAAAPASPAEGRPIIWDNSNIAESYPGITTPLTFSFARRAYGDIYRQLCRVLGVPRRTIEEQDPTFRTMLGFVRGRIYYNLLSWYRLLALVPGFRFNRRFMEGMMGVGEGLPEDVAVLPAPATRRQRVAAGQPVSSNGLRVIGTVCGLLAGYATLPRRIRRFHRHLEETLGHGRPDLHGRTAEDLAASYRDLERRLLGGWDAPLLNDLCAMIFVGLLRALSTSWCGDRDGRLAGDLLSGEGGIISAEPAYLMRRMARIAAEHGALTDALEHGTGGEIARAAEAVPAFRAACEAYLARFGDRCPGELKLESATLYDDPMPLYRAVGLLAHQQEPGAGPPRGDARAAAPASRFQAEETVRRALRWRPLRRLLFAFVLHNARARVRDRENLRFERTRVFGRARLILLELGRAFHRQGVLDDSRDVLYLEVEEVLGLVDGTATCTDLRGLAAVRKAEMVRFAAMPAPPDRFVTHGPVHLDAGPHRRPASRSQAAAGESTGQPVSSCGSWRGMPCCPGTVRARVRVVVDPAGAHVCPGEILVAERTDPGWITLFSLAGGLLVEHGSLLSHSAIVARELGIPTIVGLADATRLLRDGDWVEMDGAAGTVMRVPAPEPASRFQAEADVCLTRNASP